MRCAIIRPRAEGTVWELEEPLGAEAICGYLRERGIESRVFDRRIGAKLSQIEDYAPDAAGFSIMTQEDVPDALRLLQQLKKPGRVFFAGGLYVTGEESRCRALFPKDTALIRGEGEGPVLSLLTGRTVSPPDPDGWAFASRDDLSVYLAKGGAIHLRGSRGCRGGCGFCTTPGCAHGRHETRSIDLIVQEMVSITGQGHMPVFNFTDDEFGDLERIQELIRALDKAHLKAAFSMELRPRTVCRGTPAIWQELHRGGLCRIFTGLENLDPATLRRWNKPTDPQLLLAAAEQCEQAGIICETGYILFHEQSSASSVMQQVRQLHQHGRFTPKAALSILHLYPGSRLYAESGIDRAGPVVLTSEANALYESWSAVLGEYCELWSACAAKLPNAACRSFLTGDDREKVLLQRALRAVNALTYETVEGHECSTSAKEAMYALCRSALSCTGTGSSL